MAEDKRTAELGTMDISVAYVNGLLVVDSLTLSSVDGEQQKILISTLLEYFRNQGEDFYIGALNLTRIATTNNNTTDVMLLDGSGNVRIRNIGNLIQGTELVETEFIKVTNQISESPVQSAANQATINEQINSVLTSLQDQIDNVTNLGATATIEVSPVPFSTSTTETTIPFSTVFESTNTNIIDINDTDNKVNVYAIGTYQIAVFLDVSNADTSETHTLTLRIKNVDTDEIYSEAEIFVYKDGYTGTWINRFAVTNAPIDVYFTAESSDASDLAIEASQMNIISLSSGVADLINPYMLNVFGHNDETIDSTNLQDSLSLLAENQQLNLFGTFYLTSQIDFELLNNNLINCSAAFLKFYRTDTNPICFNIKDSKNLTFLNVSGSFEHASTTTNAYVFATEYNTVTPENIIIENLKVHLVGGTVTNYNLFYSIANSNTIHINNVFGDYGQIQVYQNSIIENVYLSDSSSYIGADLACKILKCYVNTITVTDDNNNIVSNNFATTYNGEGDSNRFSNNIGLTGGGGTLSPDDDVEITGNWYFSQNVGFGGISSPSEAVEIGGNLLLNSAVPYIDLYNSSGATDLKYWRIINNSAKLIFRSLTDAQSTNENVLTLNASNGYVGIGESSPTYPLHVDGTSYFSGNLYAIGNVGIGTTSPSYKFHVAGSICSYNATSPQIYLNRHSGSYGTTSLSDFRIYSQSGYLRFELASTGGTYEVMKMNYNTLTCNYNFIASGNVGIGTTSPSYTLHVVGTGYFSSNLNVAGTGYFSSINISNDNAVLVVSDIITRKPKIQLLRTTNYLTSGYRNYEIINDTGTLKINSSYNAVEINHLSLADSGIYTDLNFGIGTTSPSYALHVVGNSYLDGNLTVTGTFNLSGGITIANNPDKVLYIAVNSGGTIAKQNGNIIATSVTHNSTGEYYINFASLTGYNVYHQVVSKSEDYDYNAAIGDDSDTEVHIQIYDNTSTLVDSAFYLYIAAYIIV